MMSSINLMLHDLSEPIRIVALDEIQRERDRQTLKVLKPHNPECGARKHWH